ncbi:retropepsin-like aspartic protease [Nonlabens agnitus]|uniref:Aspartyl protease n=1 Tax=Nonlabens agnitus TaxID=870484 RepID=A0A2S9WVG9_9FLAO|nr:retropepsin-like aspartic protease [Nonlabens agnitus]PRP67464.1 hypothetical protein BST86_10350 [Nonlabens agnitus]
MKIVRVFICFAIIILINSCAVNKAEKYLKQGKTVQENFKETFPFEIKNGFIIVQAKIKDEDYDFILDTGSSNVISKKFAESLNLEIIGRENIYDVYNKSQLKEYCRIDTIQIGGIEFVETIGAILDFNSVPTWSSMNISGFIGSNLMQHAIWDIDFKKGQITITDDELKLNLPKQTIENKLFVGYAGIPSIACKINNERVWNFTVDLGFNGGIVIPFSEFEKQIEDGKITEFKKSITNGVIGIYGAEDLSRQSYKGIINEIEFGNSALGEEKVYSEKYLEHLFGLDFFKNYRTVINWDDKKIKLIESQE